MNPNLAARAVCDVSTGTILAVVDIAAPPERVFRAITEDVASWWGSPEMYQVTDFKSDLRVGGAWSSSGKGANGDAFSVTGSYVELDPPRLVVMTWQPSWDPGEATTVRYALAATATGTRVTLRHEGFRGRAASCEAHTDGWARVLSWLTGFLQKSEERFFLCKLLPPRSSFMKDMTAVEAALMKEHAAYWSGLAKEGKAVVYGPVADPKGGYGVGILRVANDQELAALEAADPVIKAGSGFRYEALPMLRAVVGG